MAQGLLITGPERRRSWRVEEREQILSEAFAPGAVASLVARRHDVSTGLLYSWRKKALAQLDRTAFAQAAFLPAVVEEGRAACSASGAKTRSTAVMYLASQSPSNPLYVDLSSTGATWQHLSRYSQFNVLVGIYSDVFYYTNTKPELPNGFEYLVKNSEIGNTNYLLEVFNCAKHGHIKGFDKFKASFGEPELGLTTIIDIHDPIDSAVELSTYYGFIIQDEMTAKSDEEILKLFGEMAISMSAQAGYLDEFTDYLNKEKTYLENL